jgi:hypothetical protein
MTGPDMNIYCGDVCKCRSLKFNGQLRDDTISSFRRLCLLIVILHISGGHWYSNEVDALLMSICDSGGAIAARETCGEPCWEG